MILGWLSPNGEMIEANYMEHLQIAEDLVRTYYNTDPNSIDYVTDFLLDQGWVHITMTTLVEHALRIFYNKPLTNSQKEYLKSRVEKEWDWISQYEKNSLIKDLDLEFEKVRFEWE